MKSIPRYSLYGETGGWSDGFNFEWIPQRSGPNNWNIGAHVHDVFLQFLYVESGSVEMQLGAGMWHVNAPCVIIVPAQTVHSFKFSEDVDGPVVTVGQRFIESVVSVAMPSLLQFIRKPLVMEVDGGTQHVRALLSLAHEVEREWKTSSMGQAAAGISLIMAMLVQAARICQNHTPQDATGGQSRKFAQLEKFHNLVDSHFRERMPVDFYAGKLGMTPGQLTRICREVFGKTALDMINARIVSEAERELIYSIQPIRIVASVLGFDDEAYFSRFFSKHVGMPPRAFREKRMAEIRQSA